jgi:hypothetical protein
VQDLVELSERMGKEKLVEEAKPEHPEPTGEKVWFIFGPSIVVATYVVAGLPVKDVVAFLNWKLAEHKDNLPEGYTSGINIEELTSPDELEEGLMFSPEDKITELESWEEGERHFIALGSEWQNVKYMEDDALLQKFKDAAFWEVQPVAPHRMTVIGRGQYGQFHNC